MVLLVGFEKQTDFSNYSIFAEWHFNPAVSDSHQKVIPN